jgi:gliding motility-associated-like protein
MHNLKVRNTFCTTSCTEANKSSTLNNLFRHTFKKAFLVVVIFLSASAFLLGQGVNADFSANRVSGCAPLVVSFTDLSTGNPFAWNWDLGNGQLSTTQNPVVNYSVPGVYTVRLVVRSVNGIDEEVKTNYITVSAAPVASFSANITTACVPATIQFTDESTEPPGAGNITSWLWDFGDGNSSTLQNPSHVYATTGFYSVSLVVTSSSGCTGVTGRNRYIRVVDGIEANFDFTQSVTCRPPFNINFVDQSSGPGNFTYTWNFGNGAPTSNLQNPTAVYTAPGTYPVQLTVQSSLGCGGTIQKDIVLAANATDFSFPASNCVGKAVNFVNNSNPVPVSSFWDFGDGTTSAQTNPVKTFLTGGTFTVKLINDYGNCRDSATKSITITDNPVVNFAANDSSSCSAPFTVQFTDLSPGAVSWSWNFGDGSTSTEQNPSHTYTSVGSYNVTLSIVLAGGCDNTITKTNFIRIAPTTVSISNAPAGGCFPFTFRPVAAVQTLDNIVSYSWDMGEAGAIYTTQSPTHTYTTAGDYTVQLTVTTQSGCTATTTSLVQTGTPPTVDFSFAPVGACASDSIRFTDLSTTTPNATVTWLWDFGDGETSDVQHPVHKYRQTGVITVTLTVSNNGCERTATHTVQVFPPVADFGYIVNCNLPTSVTFSDSSITDPARGPIQYIWRPGLGNTEFTFTPPTAPSFNYGQFGTFNSTLIVSNGVCSDTIIKPIVLLNLSPAFIASKTTVCKNEQFTLTEVNTNSALIVSYRWTIGGVVAADTTKTIAFSIAANGFYDVTLTTTDINGCTETITTTRFINVVGPEANFTQAGPGSCINKPVTFNDLSTPAGTITNWSWDFGDGTQQDFSAAPFTHSYAEQGTYTVGLTVTDNNGCKDVFSLPTRILITNPKADFKADSIYCPLTPMQFTDLSTGNDLTYQWTFGDGGNSTDRNPLHVYPDGDNQYTIKLNIRDLAGCEDSITKTGYVKIRSPKPAFDIVDSSGICIPLQTSFTFKGEDFESFFWEFGDGGTSTLKDPRHFYNAYGTYTPKLYLLGPGGCIDSASATVNLYSPANINITIDNVLACNTITSNISFTPPPGFKFIFYFGDGKADSSQQTSLTHTYPSPGNYTPFIVVADKSGCESRTASGTPIRVTGTIPLFGKNRKEFCDNGQVFFTNFTISNENIISSTWDFGDGTTSTEQDPSHNFTAPGTYIVSLNTVTESQCASRFTDTVRVYGTPFVNIGGRDTICLSVAEPFSGVLAQADTAITWQWNFANGTISPEQNPSVTYTSAGDYSIQLITTNKLGCADTATHAVHVAPLPTATATVNPISIISGGSSPVNMEYTGAIVSYNWSPTANLSCTTCPVPVASPRTTTDYRVDIVDRYGCANTGNVTVRVICQDENFFIPNTFSPNGDGSNDRFYPRGRGLFSIKALRVFNRWGELVFEKRDFAVNDASQGWDGMYKGRKAPADVYVYQAEIFCNNGELLKLSGNIALIL